MTNFQNELEEAYAYCEKIIKRHSKSFYYAFSTLPKTKAKAVYAIYAFCRIADDSVDEHGNKSEQWKALTKLENQLRLFEMKQEPNTLLWIALRDVFNRYDMKIQPFYDQINGQKTDIIFQSPRDINELERYCYLVAGSVGLMLLPIIATNERESLEEEAVYLGVAMQLTNILRDVGEDYRDKNRIYLPDSLRRKEGYTILDLQNSLINNSFIALWEELATRAEELYDLFQNKINAFDEDSQFPVLLSSQIYRGILGAVRKNNYNCLNQRNYVSAIEKQRIYRSVVTSTVRAESHKLEA